MYLVGLGAAPFLDPPEGFHVAVAESLRASGDWITLRVDSVRYFDKPPVPYWLMALSFGAAGPSEAAARIWPALSALGVAAVTGRIGVMLGGPRVGLLAALFVASNLGVFLFGRQVKPDLAFILWIVLAFAGFVVAYRGGGRWGLAVFYGALGLAALTKDALGALGPLLVVALFLWLTRERPYRAWVPWWGVLLLLAVALPVVRGGRAAELRLPLVHGRGQPPAELHAPARVPRRGRPAERAGVSRRERPGVPAVDAGAAVGCGPGVQAAVGGCRGPALDAVRAVGLAVAGVLHAVARSSCRTMACPRTPRWRCWPRAPGTIRSRRYRAPPPPAR